MVKPLSSLQVLDRGRRFPRPHVHEGGRRADVECAEQELLILCRVDPQQRQDCSVRHPTQRPQDGRHLHWKLNCHPRAVQAYLRTVHRYVPVSSIILNTFCTPIYIP